MAGEPSERQPKRLISVAEAGRRLGISESAAYRLAATGSLPGQVKLPGARTWVRARILEAWLEGEEASEDAPEPPTVRRNRRA
jgi:predicted DNA-binding transcriptional regulator AlpA